jgi:hypothetical protein
MSLLNLAVERLSDSVIGYYHLWRYLDTILKHRLSRASVHSIKSATEFYEGIREGRIKHGDRVVFQHAFLTEWVPRLPGGIHAALTRGVLKEADSKLLSTVNMFRSIIVNREVSIPPFGSVRLPLQHGKRIALGAVTEEEYHADFGVVLSVSPSVYAAYLAKRQNDNAVVGRIEGIVEFFDRPRDFPDVHLLTKEFTNAVAPPSCVICIDSPLQVRFSNCSTHPRLTAWAIRRLHHKTHGMGYDLFYTFVGNNIDELRLARELIRNESIFVNIESSVDEFRTTREFLTWRKSANHEEFVRTHLDEFRCVTEYDSRIGGLDPLVPLTIDPRQDQKVASTTSEVLSELRASESMEMQPYQRHAIVAIPPVFAVECEDTGKPVKFEPFPSRFIPLQEGCLRIPATDTMPCPYCGKLIDLLLIRAQIAEKTGLRLPDST